MQSTVLLFLSLLLFFSILIIIVRTMSTGVTDVVTLLALTFGLFYGFRPLLFALGLDTPYPDRFFQLDSSADLAAKTLLWISLYLAMLGIGLYIVIRLIQPTNTLFYIKRPPTQARLISATAVLTALAGVVSVLLLARFGGVGSLISAVKEQKSLKGLYSLKVPASVGAIVAAGAFVELRRRSAPRTLSFLALAFALFDGFGVFMWGQRSTLVVIVVIVLFGPLATRTSQVPASKALTRIALAVVVVIAASAGLRVARDTLAHGEVQSVVADATIWRQMSLSTNSVYFDASMLAFRDWPARYDYRDGEDFYLGAVGIVPRLVWSGKPVAIDPGSWFRQVYQPNIVNGWPTGAPTLWYLDFGPIGLLFGGLLSGFALGWIACAQRRSARIALNAGISLVVVVYVFQLGWAPQMPVYYGIWLVPLGVITAYLNRGHKQMPPERPHRAGIVHPPARHVPTPVPMAPGPR